MIDQCRRARGFRSIVVAAAVLGAIGSTASAQTSLSAPSISNNSSANELANGLFDNPTYERESETSSTSSASTFSVRYRGLASTDCGILCGGRTETLSSDYTVSWTATAPNLYRLSISTRRTAGLTIVDEGANGAATMGALSCTRTGGTLQSGGCTLSDPADNTSGSTSDVNVDQINTMTLCGQSLGAAQAHSLRFTWSQSATTPSTGLGDADEAAVRLGGDSDDGTETAADYPGVNSRTKANDGHFLTVSITNLCGNGVIDTCGATPEGCDEGLQNGSASSCCNANCTLKPVSITCRAASPGDVCDETEVCDGVNGACPTDGVKPNTVVCRTSAGVCDEEETCDGTNKTCPNDAKMNGTVCRASAGACDVAETCNGVDNNCPNDGFKSSTVVCRAAADTCDQAENCPGNAIDCPADGFKAATVVCRSAAGVCDLAEHCTGTGIVCPADDKKSNGTPCTSDGNACTVDECDGTNDACQHPAGNAGATCRGSGGACDVAEECDGSSPTCPADAFLPSSTVCRAASPGETCDQSEVCPGDSALCPPDDVKPASTVCRADAGECDVQEICDGSSKFCPPDSFETAGTPCTSDGELCTLDQCNGAGVCTHPAGNAGTECRAAAGFCDVAESCDGSSTTCPADAFQPDDTDCGDTLFCNGTDSCQTGVCVNSGPPCSGMESCDESSAQCFTGQCPSVAVTCRTAEKSILVIKDKEDNTKDKLIWKWIKGASTTLAEFSNPAATANYAVCVYHGPGQSLIGSAEVAPGNGWVAKGSKGFKYKDLTGSQAGIQQIILTSSDANKSKILVKGGGDGLPDFTVPFASTDFPVVVQLRNNETGICWEGSYANPTKNGTGGFKAKN